ncbi:MAG: hypothetical protein IIB46_07695, partial [Nitrospinae bacterium]|nr:hypothetical protein [Nitrospinota bacterium]
MENSFLDDGDTAEDKAALDAVNKVLGGESESISESTASDLEGQDSEQEAKGQTPSPVDEGLDEEGNVLGAEKQTTDTEKKDEADEPENQEDDDIEVDSRLYDAGIAAGLSEDEIGILAESNPKMLESLAADQEAKKPDAKPSNVQTEKTVEDEVDKGFTLDTEAFTPEQLKSLEPLLNKVNEIGENQSKMVKKSTDQEVNLYFNQLHDDFPEFGNLDNKNGVNILTPSQRKSRTEVCNHANLLQLGSEVLANEGQGQPMTTQQALNLAMNAHRGVTADQRATEKIVNKLNKNKKTFIPRSKGRR